MAKILILFFFITLSCDTGHLKVIMDIPMELKEVSGLAIDEKNAVLWMINDSGNKPILYGLNTEGQIIRDIRIKAKNRDWEDLTMDPFGTIYIGNFGNNDNDSKGLSILKVSKDELLTSDNIKVDRINFVYPEQKEFPPKKKKRHFDCEAFFFYKDSLYLFTKSRNPEDKGKTHLYQLPASSGNYKATYLSSFTTCSNDGCWVTSADINTKGDLMVLLTEGAAYLFSDFKDNAFFDGNVKRFPFNHRSQKESVCFKNDSTLYIADEYRGVDGGNLYEFHLN